MESIKAINWLIPWHCTVVQRCRCTNQLAGLFRVHSYSKLKGMKTALPLAKGLFNGHSCTLVGLVVCLLSCSCWVKVGGHEIGFTWIPTISPELTIFYRVGLTLQLLANVWVVEDKTVMCAPRPSCNNVDKHAYDISNNNLCLAFTCISRIIKSLQGGNR